MAIIDLGVVMMVGSWPCKVLSEIHIDGRRVSELVQKDKGKATVLESEDEKDLREHAWCCPRVVRWSGWVTQGYQGMLQELWIEDKSRVTLAGLVRFTGNMTQIDGQIRLFETAGVTRMDTRVDRQTGLLGTARVTGTAAQVSRQIRLLGPR
jgi:hypothetical protein